MSSFICGGSVRGGNSIGYGVDGGDGSGSEVLMKHIGIGEEDALGYSVGSFDGITYGRETVVSFLENILNKRPDEEVVGSGCGP